MAEQMQANPPQPLAPEHVEVLAHVCHEANRALCVARGDLSQPTWEEAPDWQKESARDGVRFVSDRPGYKNPRDSHDNWMNVKLRSGWRYGPEKDVEQKTHPCLLPFNELTAEQKDKDAVFLGIVQGYLQHRARGH